MDAKYYNTFGSEIPDGGEPNETADTAADTFSAEEIIMTDDSADSGEVTDTAPAADAEQTEYQTADDPSEDNASQTEDMSDEESESAVNDGQTDKLVELVQSVGECRAKTSEMSGKLDLLTAQMNSVNSLMTRLAAYDTAVETLKLSLAANQNAEKNLYNEVEQYKRGVQFTTIRPFLMFLIERVEDLKTSKKQYESDKEQFIAENNEAVYNEIVNLISFYINAFDDFLRYNGVDIISFEPETPVVTGSQRIIKTVSSDDPSKHGTVAQVLSDCYMYEDKVLKAASVYAYKK